MARLFFNIATKNISKTPPLLLPLFSKHTFASSPFSSASNRLHPFPPIKSSPSFHPSQTGSDSEVDEFRVTTGLGSYQQQLLLGRFLRLVIQSKDLSSSEEDAIAFLQASGFRPTTEDLVSAGMWELRNEWKSAFLAFRWGQKCESSSEKSWNLMVWVLGKHRKFKMAWQLVREMHELDMATRSALLIMIKRYAAADEAGKAVKTFHAMDKFKVTTDSSAFYTLLHSLCKHKNIEEAEELMYLNKKLYPLETASFNIILNGWCNILVDVIEAKRIWREMSNCCIHPDGTSYTLMICCFSRVGNLFDSLRLYDEMRKRGWIPDLVVYNSLIYVLTTENCWKEAHNMINKIVEKGLHPNVDTYNSIIHSLCVVNQLEEAKRILVEMVEKGIEPNADAFKYIIYPLCEANKLKEARNLLDQMINKGLKPDMETFHEIVKVENMSGTLKLMNQMREAGCGPNKSTFLLLFNNFFKRGLPGDVLRVWTEMEKYDIVPGVEHYSMLVEGLARCGWLNKAREFYHEMKLRGFSDDPKLQKILRGSVGKNKKARGPGRGREDAHII